MNSLVWKLLFVAVFAHFPNATGVANVAQYANRIKRMPAWITPSTCGAGFVELVDALLAARQE